MVEVAVAVVVGVAVRFGIEAVVGVILGSGVVGAIVGGGGVVGVVEVAAVVVVGVGAYMRTSILESLKEAIRVAKLQLELAEATEARLCAGEKYLDTRAPWEEGERYYCLTPDYVCIGRVDGVYSDGVKLDWAGMRNRLDAKKFERGLLHTEKKQWLPLDTPKLKIAGNEILFGVLMALHYEQEDQHEWGDRLS